MKRIVKSNNDIQSQIDSWTTQAKRKSEADWSHFSQNNKQNSIYATTKASLVNEQGKICCYCERRISIDQSTHIEHFKGKGKYQNLMFSYKNLHASCDGFSDKADHCCGHKRAQQGNPDIPVSPLHDNCESRFRFTGRGEMKPTRNDDVEASNTIDFLGLNSFKLRGMRKTLMYLLEGCVKGMTEDEFVAFIKEKLQVDADGRFSEFFTTIRCYAEDLMGKPLHSV